MIFQYLIIWILMYMRFTFGQPIDDTSVKKSNLFDASDLSLTENNFLSDQGVETLLTKITELSKRYKNNENATVADVQHMLDTDQSLPRLTRGEIIDLLENLSKTNPEEIRNRVVKIRHDYQRALMLVMPYTPNKADGYNIEELYTKAPITRIIGTDSDKTKNIIIPKAQSTTPKPYIPKKNVEILDFNSNPTAPPKRIVNRKPIRLVKEPESFAPEPKPIRQISIKQVEVKPEIVSTTHKPMRMKVQINNEAPTTHKPMRMKVEINTDTTPTTHKPLRMKPSRFSNHKYPEVETKIVSSNEGMRIITPPALGTEPSAINADYWHYLQKENVPKTEKPLRQRIRPNSMQSSVYKNSISTTIKPRTTTTSTSSPFKDIGVPEELKDAMSGVDIPQKYSSHYDASAPNFPKQEEVTENIRDLLESIGVLPEQTSTEMPDISNIADNLSPEMKNLLMTFGLIENPNKTPEPAQPYFSPYIGEESQISPSSYTQFKPLPDGGPSGDMQEFLANFGLTGNSDRFAKELKATEKPKYLSQMPQINTEFIPESMHSVLDDLGLAQKKGRKLSLDKTKNEETEKTHVFNPENHNVSDEEIKRLNQLLETIKRLEKLNRTATPDDLKDLDLENIKELNNILRDTVPLDQKDFGPNPLDFDFGGEKNEVKRQESTTTTTEKSTSTSEEPRNPSLAALEDSFGGPSGSGSQVIDESLPPPRKTGFYYLLDWNSFLEVGEEGRNKVNIRFSPRAGDPSRFFRVNVP